MIKSAKHRATVICHQQGKVLLVRKADAKWTLPGGKIEANEGPAEAALRELCEETGLDSQGLEFLALHQFDSRPHHVFRVTVPETLAARPLNEIADCRWFSTVDLDMAIKKSARKLLELYFPGDSREPA